MAKDNSIYWIIGIIALIAIAVIGPKIGLFSVIVPDDYLIYDNFLVPDSIFEEENVFQTTGCGDRGTFTFENDYGNCIEIFSQRPGCDSSSSSMLDATRECTNNKWITKIRTFSIVSSASSGCYPSGTGSIVSSFGILDLTAYKNPLTQITPNKNFLGMDVKMDFSVTFKGTGCGSADYGTFDILINDQVVYTRKEVVGQSGSLILDYLLEIKSSKLYPSNAVLMMNGQEVKEFTGLDELYVTVRSGLNSGVTAGSTIIKLNTVKYKVPFSCIQGPNDLLAMESFTGGQELSIYSTRYTVQSFCLDHPVIITSPEGSAATAEPYNVWIQGGTLTVPADETWTVFYVLHNDGSIPVTCPDEFFDVATGTCTQASGIVQICSEGTFDPELGLCVVQPESVCAEGYFDTSLGQCVYHPPIQYVCPQGNYNTATGKCEYTPETAEVCPEGYTYSPISELCEFIPSTQIVCPAGTAYSAIEDACIGEGRILPTVTAEEQCHLLGGDLIDGSCTFEESHKNWCIQQGFDYDSSKDSCTYVEEVIPEEVQDETSKGLTDIPLWVYMALGGILIYYIFIEAGPNKGFFQR